MLLEEFLQERLRNHRSDDRDARPGVVQREGFARCDRSPTYNDSVNRFTAQGDWKCTQRNCPLLSDETRNTTYISITLANVIAERIAARLA